MHRARIDAAKLDAGLDLGPIRRRDRIPQMALQAGMEVLEDICGGWRGSQVRSVQVGGQVVHNMPILMSSLTKTAAFAAYRSRAVASHGLVQGMKPLGPRTFGLIYDALAKLTENKASLSYYFTDGLHALTLLQKMVKRAEELLVSTHNPANAAVMQELNALPLTLPAVLELVYSSEAIFKYELRTHMILNPLLCDGNPLHCCAFAVGAICTKPHAQIRACVTCGVLVVLPNIANQAQPKQLTTVLRIKDYQEKREARGSWRFVSDVRPILGKINSTFDACSFARYGCQNARDGECLCGRS
jgi:hypothetical protein